MRKPLTQQGAFRKDRKALERAEKKGLSDKDIIMKMTEDMDNPNSANTVIEAAAGLNYCKALCRKETPIADAVNSLLKPSPSSSPSPFPSGSPSPKST